MENTINHKRESSEQPLIAIIGHDMDSVVFVRDYVQLIFGRCGLTALTWPTIKVGEIWTTWGLPGYRDKLCERIGKVVRAASVKEGEEIRIEFQDESIVAISLRPEDYCTAEAAIFDNGPENTWVW